MKPVNTSFEEDILQEYRAYETMKDELLKKYEGKVVVIRKGKVIGVYNSEEEALKDVLEKFGLKPVLIKRVLREEKTEHIPAYTYGLLTVAVG